MSERSTLLNATIGAAVTVVFTFIPFSPVLGGAVASYLQGGDYRDGAKVGAISGAISTIPMALVVMLVAAIFALVPVAGGELGIGLFFGFLFVVIVSLTFLYTVGLSALGGVLGIVIADEFQGREADRQTEPDYVEPPVQTTEEERQDEF